MQHVAHFFLLNLACVASDPPFHPVGMCHLLFEVSCLLLQLLTEPSQCYLVLLIATAGMTFRNRQSSPQQPQQGAQPPSGQTGVATPQQQQTLVSSC